MNKKTIAFSTVAIMLMAAIVAAPGVEAQKPAFDFQVKKLPSGAVEALIPINFEIAYTYTLNNPGQNTFGQLSTATVEFKFKCPPTVSITGDTTKIIALSASQQTEYTGTAALQMVVSRDAKALESLKCDVDGTVTEIQNQGVPAPDQKSTSFSVTADYYSLIEAKTDVKLKPGGPQKQIPFEIAVTNFGNGQTKVSFALEGEPGGKWQGLLPDQLLLDDKDGNRPSTTATFTVVTPFKNGWNNEEGGFTLKITPEYAYNADKKGSEVVVNLVARVRGVYVPSLEPMIMVGAVLGTALVARMMRQDEE